MTFMDYIMTFMDYFKDTRENNKSPPIAPYLVLFYLIFIPLIIILTFVNSILLIMSYDDKEYEKDNIRSNANPHIRNTAITTIFLSLTVAIIFSYIIINIVFKKKIKLISNGVALSLFVIFYFLFSMFSIASAFIYISYYSAPQQQYFNLGLNIFILIFYGFHFPIPLLLYMCGLTINFMDQKLHVIKDIPKVK
jgi:hypothetical protein